MTTTVCRQIYVVLIGALLVAINLKEADSFTITSDGVRGFESRESHELFTSAEDHLKRIGLQRPANNGQAIARHSDEHDDSSEFRIAVGTVAPAVGRNPTIRTVNQVTRAPTANVRLPVSFHSDEHDDLSDEERSITGILSSNKQVASIQMTPNAGSQAGQRITKHPDERLIVSAQPGKQVIIRTVTTPVSVQPPPIHKAMFRHSDEHDDYSDEIVSRVSVLNAPPIPNVPAVAAKATGLGQTTNPQPPLDRPRSGGRVDLPWLEHADDIDVQIDPITKQIVNVRAEQKDSIEHDDLFSDEITRSRMPPTPTFTALNTNPIQLNAGIQTPVNGPPLPLDNVARVLNQQNVQIRPATLGQAAAVIVGRHLIDHSDEVDDHSVEIHHVRTGIPTRAVSPGVGTPAIPPTDVRHLLADSSEHDVSLEGVLHLSNGQTQRTAVHRQGVFRDSDERDVSSEVVRRILNQHNLTRSNHQDVHRVSHSDERDDTSVEVILHVRNGTATVQRMPSMRHSHELDDTSDEMRGIGRSLPMRPIGQQGVRVVSRQSHERDDSMEMIGLVRKVAVTPHETTVIGGHVIRHSDEIDDDSSELHHVGSQSPPGGGRVPATPGVGHHFRHSDEHDVSIEDVIGVRHQPANGQIQAAPVHPGVRILEDSHEHDDSRERRGRVLDHQGRPINTTVYHRESDEHDDLSLEVDLSLLPEIQRLFTGAKADAVAPPAVQHQQGMAASIGGRNHGNQAVQNAVEMDVSLEVEDILANPLFQRKIQEIDDRLKSMPDVRGKRLIEKYAEALALSSPSFSSAPSIIQSSFYLPLLFTCLLVWFS
ncbi:uncharacterized protein LOC130693786 [Daphnia carinata]|uniref:uncharacterized protein LOC130693786 n=1 Tax=Daphnia carinata TaxID=120202 RepID=UPI00257D04E1|nr:uncharacterized protein LOC130693786 [Daphnia carinata]